MRWPWVQRGPNIYNNNTPPIPTYETISATTVRANGIISSTISATNGGSYQPPAGQTASLLIDLNVDPTMVILPVNGGKFYRVTGQWTGPPNNGIYPGSANSDPANGVTLGDQTQQYWVYHYCTTQRFMNGAATPTETQITCSTFVLK